MAHWLNEWRRVDIVLPKITQEILSFSTNIESCSCLVIEIDSLLLSLRRGLCAVV